MPPKSQTSTNTQVFVVWSSRGIDSVHATLQSASAHLATNKGKYSIESTNIQGGTILVTEEKAATKQKGTSKAQAVKKEDDGEEEEEEEEEEAAAAKPAVAKKTKTPAEQRAANAAKPSKASDVDLPDNVKALLREGGTVFENKTVVVTGVPPTLGRKNTEKLVEAFGAHLGKSLSRKTDYVVVGNDAGPKKLLQIEDLGLKTLDEDDLIALLEGGTYGGVKRESSDEEAAPPPKPKKQKR